MPNGEGIIDSDYYHQTYVMLYNASADTVYIEDNPVQGFGRFQVDAESVLPIAFSQTGM